MMVAFLFPHGARICLTIAAPRVVSIADAICQM
jgi:hypothetical protein